MNILITGVTSGIGRALTKTYIDNGHRVVGIARRRERLEELKKEYGDDFDYIEWDLGIVGKLSELVEEIERGKIEVDILINNAGTGSYGEFLKTSMEQEMKMIDLNITTLTYLTKVFLKKMKEKNKGGVINVASTAAFQGGGPLMSSYYGTKSYVLTLDEGIRGELLEEKKNNVRVMTLCPGPTLTEFIGMDKSLEALYITTPEEVASRCYIDYELGREICIPGLANRMSYFIGKFIPRKVLRMVIYRIQKKKRL